VDFPQDREELKNNPSMIKTMKKKEIRKIEEKKERRGHPLTEDSIHFCDTVESAINCWIQSHTKKMLVDCS
jgi:hypothetical protein